MIHTYMKRITTAAIVMYCAAATAPAVAAQQRTWYGGIAVGESRTDMTTRDWNDATLSRKELNNKSAAYKLTAGYQFTPHLAGELSYVHFGDTKFNGYEPGTTPTFWQTGNVYGRALAKGMSLTGVASWTFHDRLTLLARGGILMWNTSMYSNPTLSGGTLALSDQQVLHDNGVRFIYGAGVSVRVYRRWHMRLEWEHATVRFASTMDRGIDFPSLGVTLDL
jgi:opacity protein-like surface antigen